MRTRIYFSRKSWILGLFLIVMLLVGYPIFPHHYTEIGAGFIIYALVVGFVFFLWFGLNYILEDDLLKIRIGPIITHRIQISDITRVYRSFNPISSPAASLKRLCVIWKGGEVLISPQKERAFVEALRVKNTSIRCELDWGSENDTFFTRLLYSIL